MAFKSTWAPSMLLFILLAATLPQYGLCQRGRQQGWSFIQILLIVVVVAIIFGIFAFCVFTFMPLCCKDSTDVESAPTRGKVYNPVYDDSGSVAGSNVTEDLKVTYPSNRDPDSLSATAEQRAHSLAKRRNYSDASLNADDEPQPPRERPITGPIEVGADIYKTSAGTVVKGPRRGDINYQAKAKPGPVPNLPKEALEIEEV